MPKQGFTRTVSTADMSGTPRLVLEQPTGDVSVEGWDRPEIEISISDDRELFDVALEGSQVTIRNISVPKHQQDPRAVWEAARGELQNLGDVGANIERVAARVERQVERAMRRVEQKMGGIHIDLGRWSGGRDYTIRVPHNCDLSLRTSSGDLEVLRVTGTHFLQSSSGDINLDKLDGAMLVASASGDISYTDSKGKLGARSASGDITVVNGQLHELSVTTASGDINLDLRIQPERDFEIKGVSGDVEVKLPHDARLSIEVNTLSGHIHSGFRGETNIERRHPGKRGTLELNGGGLHGRIQTVSGDINIYPKGGRRDDGEGSEGQGTVDLSRSSVQPGDITEPEGERRREAERSILSALERGDITVEEAMGKLREL
jgi:hypothetical protein